MFIRNLKYIFLLVLCTKFSFGFSVYDISFHSGIDIYSGQETGYFFSWKLSDFKTQSAFEIEIKPDTNTNKVFYASGKVHSNKSILVPYTGPALLFGEVFFFRIKTYTTDNLVSSWSPYVALFTPLKPEQWKGSWIGVNKIEADENIDKERTQLSARYVKKTILIKKRIKHATLYYSGLGWSYAFVNNKPINANVLSPNLSNYFKSCYYLAEDITSHLHVGKNELQFILGNARLVPQMNVYSVFNKNFGLPRLRAQLRIQYTDDSVEEIFTDKSWLVTNQGPIRANNEFFGEIYDANKENIFTSADAWKPADIMTAPGGNMILQRNPPMTIKRVYSAKKIYKIGSDFIIDFGQNMSGWVQWRLNGKKGQVIQIRHAEFLKANGDLYMDNVSDATDTYVFARDTQVTYHPIFTYHGFRFAKISGIDYEPSLSDIEAHFIYDDVSTTADFKCDNPIVNQVWKNCMISLASNLKSIPTDDPVRNERGAYLGDRVQVAKSEMYLYNTHTFYAKVMQDIVETQLPSGELGYTAPAFWEYYHKSITWPGAYIDFLHNLYEVYGRIDLLHSHYPIAKKWWLFIDSLYLKNNLLPTDNHGEWVPAPSSTENDRIHTQVPERHTPKEYMGALFFYYYSLKLSQIASIIGNTSDADTLVVFCKKFKEKIHAHFFNTEKQQYANNSGLENVLALYFDIVPLAYKKQVIGNLLENIDVMFKGVPTGLVGTKFILRTLAQQGKHNKAFQLASQTTYPSWGYMVTQGATSVWELWNGNTASPEMNSHNNAMMVGDYPLYCLEYLAGICNHNNSAWKESYFALDLPENLNQASASIQTAFGVVASSWIRSANEQVLWNITVPGNTRAQIVIPSHTYMLDESTSNAIWKSNDSETGFPIYTLSPGVYTFSFKYTPHRISESENRSAFPRFSCSDTVATKPFVVSLTAGKQAKIYYTLDGSQPSEKSNLYTKPILVEKFSIIKAIAIEKGKQPSFVNMLRADIINPVKQGIRVAYFEGTWKKLPDFTKESKLYDTIISKLDLKSFNHTDDHFGAVFTAYLDVPKAGNYTFYINSDDGTQLYLDDKILIDHDGIHGPEEKSATIFLEKRKIPIRIAYFEGDWGENIALYISGPGISKSIVPRSFFVLER